MLLRDFIKSKINLPEERYFYKFFTDKWMFLVVLLFYIVIKYQLMPKTITDVYIPFILIAVKFIWTKTSYIRIYSDNFVYCHKEIPTYKKKRISHESIIRIHFKQLFFTTTDHQYCLIEYVNQRKKIKNILIKLDNYSNPERVRKSLLNFAKRNQIETIKD